MIQPYPTIEIASQADHVHLLQIWEASVRATHLFLTEEHVQSFIPLVRDELAHFSPLHCLRNGTCEPIAFMGVANGKIEMLFVAPDCRGSGAGRKLVEYAVEQLGARYVDVNEQNEQAVGFYRHMGFEPVGRSELDPMGNPFPILHMRLYPSAR